MATNDTTPSQSQKKGIFTVSLGPDVGSLLMGDASAGDRSVSYVVRKICEQRYAPQLKRLRAERAERAAAASAQSLRRAA